MFIEDIKNDFYNVILGNRVLLLVHFDVDAVCSCKILQGLFKCDNIPYTLVPVGGVSELKKAYDENNEEVKYVVLVNCGGTIDIVDILQPEEDVVFFVLDSHKPTDVCNVYSDGQVRLVHKDSEENIPNFDDIFRDDEDEEEPEPDSGREGLEALVERRRERRQWEEKRHTLMFNYTQFSYFGKASAIVSYELAWRLSRASTGALWAGCVAAAWQEEARARDRAHRVLDAEALHRTIAGPDTDDAARVVLQKDLTLPLYRSWSLEAAITHAPALAPALRLHNALAGASRVRALLAATGIPLQQARQAYRSMDVDLRRSLLTSLDAAATQHKLPSVCRAAFVLQAPHAATIADIDVMYIIMALIEHEHLPPSEGFQLALACLAPAAAGAEGEPRARGAAAARRALQHTAALAHGLVAAKKLCLAGPFSYFIVQEGTPEAPFVRGPHWLGLTARWVSALAGGSRPLLASAPRDSQHCILLGLPPRHDTEPRNLFGAAFSTAAARCGAAVQLDCFDASVVSLPHAQRALFLDALTALLS